MAATQHRRPQNCRVMLAAQKNQENVSKIERRRQQKRPKNQTSVKIVSALFFVPAGFNTETGASWTGCSRPGLYPSDERRTAAAACSSSRSRERGGGRKTIK